MNRPCLDCQRPTPRTRCDECRRLRNRQLGSSTQRGYDSKWRTERDKILKENPYCQEPMCWERSTEVDHIIPKALGGGNERSNLRATCRWHNRSKGARVA